MYCGYCGKEINEGEVCNCKEKGTSVNKNKSIILATSHSLILCAVCLILIVGITGFIIYNFSNRPEGTYVSLYDNIMGEDDGTERFVLKGGFFKKNSGKLEIYEGDNRLLDEYEDSTWELDGDILTLVIDGNRKNFYFDGEAIIDLEDGIATPDWEFSYNFGSGKTFEYSIIEEYNVRDVLEVRYTKDGKVEQYWNGNLTHRGEYEINDNILSQRYTEAIGSYDIMGDGRAYFYISNNKYIIEIGSVMIKE